MKKGYKNIIINIPKFQFWECQHRPSSLVVLQDERNDQSSREIYFAVD